MEPSMYIFYFSSIYGLKTIGIEVEASEASLGVIIGLSILTYSIF